MSEEAEETLDGRFNPQGQRQTEYEKQVKFNEEKDKSKEETGQRRDHCHHGTRQECRRQASVTMKELLRQNTRHGAGGFKQRWMNQKLRHQQLDHQPPIL